jgi:hypothetical protein
MTLSPQAHACPRGSLPCVLLPRYYTSLVSIPPSTPFIPPCPACRSAAPMLPLKPTCLFSVINEIECGLHLSSMYLVPPAHPICPHVHSRTSHQSDTPESQKLPLPTSSLSIDMVDNEDVCWNPESPCRQRRRRSRRSSCFSSSSMGRALGVAGCCRSTYLTLENEADVFLASWYQRARPSAWTLDLLPHTDTLSSWNGT